MATIQIPSCFSSREQYALWMRSARSTKPGRSGYCEDCTPEYKRKMVEQNRCEYPATWFHTDEDGFVAGVRVGGGVPGKPGRPRKYA
jgi:hypothetical protein